MDDFINVIKKDPQVQKKMKNILDKFNKLPYNYQSQTGYYTLIQNVILKEIMNLMSTTIIDIDTKLKMKKKIVKYLESKSL